mmetsp:Transcript_5561/g.21748  ORF Transcript_5561/g.21748 Transcript_5561/m.21748 type:complete len:256 (+) Transcript_5561:3188-3955(+)
MSSVSAFTALNKILSSCDFGPLFNAATNSPDIRLNAAVRTAEGEGATMHLDKIAHPSPPSLPNDLASSGVYTFIISTINAAFAVLESPSSVCKHHESTGNSIEAFVVASPNPRVVATKHLAPYASIAGLVSLVISCTGSKYAANSSDGDLAAFTPSSIARHKAVAPFSAISSAAFVTDLTMLLAFLSRAYAERSAAAAARTGDADDAAATITGAIGGNLEHAVQSSKAATCTRASSIDGSEANLDARKALDPAAP